MATKLIALNSNYFLFPETAVLSSKSETWSPNKWDGPTLPINSAVILRVLIDRTSPSKEHAYRTMAMHGGRRSENPYKSFP